MSKLKIKVRFDYMGKSKGGKLFMGGKDSEHVAEEIRQHKVSLIRNIPVQGIHIEDIDMSQEIYSIYDDITGKRVTYAPVIISLSADTIEDLIRFTMKEEFRTIEILEPQEITLSKHDIERFIFKTSEELKEYKNYLERRIDSWK
ncbi:dehydrogenase [Candidatus Syntrophocurvum alkaliphilum]|uniref:Dehydrogenase n=1 Tax=Candidatus Syntrophocurvum alkaliphilum TaxID=2293317 RepID=A0A6I6DAR6_9FIRM|nr:hypothetical protein [Candidatus Syntrophocurvum alkaliphilum]QGT99878.1 dehydrogenase [Candidatus Syntrophocurvum alkaliphilum]